MVAARLVVRGFSSLPADISRLHEESLAEGHQLVKRFVDEWSDGSNRFDRPGEVALEARLNGSLVGVGGLNRDPYIDDPEAGRIRHLYVSPGARHQGVGRALLLALVEEARTSFRRLRLRTNQPEAAQLYLRLGFEEAVDEPEATHVLWL